MLETAGVLEQEELVFWNRRSWCFGTGGVGVLEQEELVF